jgi:hypothetical protein
MKKLSILALMAVVLGALSLTSCNVDNSSSTSLPSKTEATYMFSELGSRNTGTLLYYGTSTQTLDSINGVQLTVTASDSMAYITDFPVSIYSRYIKDQDLREALAEAGSETLKVKLIPYSYNSKVFVGYPYTLDVKLNYGGAEHTASFQFWGAQYTYLQMNYSNTYRLVFTITLAGVYLDKSTTSLLAVPDSNGTYTTSSAIPCYFAVKK